MNILSPPKINTSNQKNPPQHDKAHGHRIILPMQAWVWLLCFIFLSSVCISAYTVFFPRVRQTAERVCTQTPYAVPAVCILSETSFTNENLTAFSAMGDMQSFTVQNIMADQILDADLYRMEYRLLSQSLILREGRMPQNINECVVLPLTSSTPALQTTLHITAADSAQDTMRTLTIVGVAENARSAFFPYAAAEQTPNFLLYSVPAEQEEPTAATFGMILAPYSTDTLATDALYQTAAAYTDTQKQAYLDALAEKNADASANDPAASAALEAKRAELLYLENQAVTKQTQIADAEAALMEADAALQADRQAFNTEMERYEHHATNQTSMIPRKEEAEQAFAERAAEIEEMRQALNALYATQISLEQQIAEAKTEIDIYSQNSVPASSAVSENQTGWQIITQKDAYYGYTQFLQKGKAAGDGFLHPMLFIGIITTVFAYIVARTTQHHGQYSGGDIAWYILCVCLTACLGGLVGGCLLPQIRFVRMFSTFSSTLHLHFTTLLPRLLAAAAAAAGLPSTAAMIGLFVRRKAETSHS